MKQPRQRILIADAVDLGKILEAVKRVNFYILMTSRLNETNL